MTTLLLHICCGPCATHVIDLLRDGYELTGYFYNPNIHPDEEYRRRLDAAREVCRMMSVPLIEGPGETEPFYAAVAGFESEPENGARCPRCYHLRLERTAAEAAVRGFDAFASTLTLGPQKRAAVINPIGDLVASRQGVAFLAADWKKRDGFKHACELSRAFDLYRQHYCGCAFSLRDRMRRDATGDGPEPSGDREA